MKIKPRSAPLEYGSEVPLQLRDAETFATPKIVEYIKTIKSSAALVTIYVPVNAGVLTVEYYTRLSDANDAGEKLLDTQVISGPTAEAEVVRLDDVNATLLIRITNTAAAEVELRVKAASSVTSGDASQDVTDGVNNTPLVLQNPQISNIQVATANTEIPIVLPAGTKKYAIKARGQSRLQFSYVLGESGTVYWTEFPGFTFEENNVDRQATTIYVQTSKPNEVLEVKTWT